MTRITMTSHLRVMLMSSNASDDSVVQAMLVSTQGEDSQDAEASFGRINFLMKNRHGTPFEHNQFVFWVAAPIFVFREFHRHRIGWSYNEESGRYKQLDPFFYVPNADRKLMQVGKPGAYQYVPGTPLLHELVSDTIQDSCRESYAAYERMLEAGVAKEVARMVLPVNIFSSMYATCNARSLMAFLSLRQARTEEEAKFPSTPMHEINVVADLMEDWFESLMPLTHRAWLENGCVAP